MSMIMEILEGLWNTTAYYKGMRVNIFGAQVPFKKGRRDASLKKSLYRLKVKGFAKDNYGKWSLTKEGKEYFAKIRGKVLKNFQSPFNKTDPKNLLVMFDVPERKKAERNWFRRHLIKFNYSMIQKSVWVGPGPLPKEFISYVKSIGLQSSVKSFKLAKGYSGKTI